MDEHKTMAWWRTLSALATLNLGLWLWTALTVEPTGYVRAHLVLSGIYTAVCAFRSFAPRIDLERYALFDHWTSATGLGRSAATIAEISFGTQIGLLLHEAGGMAGLPWLQALAAPVAIACAVAQGFCWSSVISLSHLGHAIEESIWAATFTAVGVGLAVAGPLLDGIWSTGATVGAVGCAGYVLFMVTVDVPMYVKRWRASLAAGDPRMGLAEGWRDAWTRRVVTRDWAIWKPEVAWLTGYFTFAVWTSLALVHLPR